MDTLSKNEDITEVIVNYLKSHPDFFREHSWLLRELNVPHDTGKGKGVSSLIERQVVLLRNHIKAMEQESEARDAKYRQERILATGSYSLTMELLSRNSLDSLYHSMSRFLTKYGIADTFKIYIFADGILEHSVPDITFLQRQANLKLMFIELINRRKPLCGSLQEEHIKLLFGRHGDDTHSSLVIPMVHTEWDGLFVLGSRSPDRYAYGNELDTLIFITNIIGRKLTEWFGHGDVSFECETGNTVYYPNG